MTKAQIIAALATFGITLPASSTSTQLQTALNEAQARKAAADAAAEDASRQEEEAKARQAAGESPAQAVAANSTVEEKPDESGKPGVTEAAAPAVASSTAPAPGEEETIYQANSNGYEAYEDGDDVEDNPYLPGSQFAAAWHSGFKRAEDEDEDESVIQEFSIMEKIRVGLTREQAIDVIETQRRLDAGY